MKRLIVARYDGLPVVDAWFPMPFKIDDGEARKSAYKVEITEVEDYNGDGAANLADVAYLIQSGKNVPTLLQGNGDYRGDECVRLLQEACIVCTNPLLKLLRGYVAQLVRHEKKFLMIGQQKAIIFEEIVRHIKTNAIWLENKSGDMGFKVPPYR